MKKKIKYPSSPYHVGKIELPEDDRFPILCSDGTVIYSVEEAREKEKEYPGSFSKEELADFIPNRQENS